MDVPTQELRMCSKYPDVHALHSAILKNSILGPNDNDSEHVSEI